MYFNVELQEVQYFNPKNTIGQFFIDLFNKKNFLLNSQILSGKGPFKILKQIEFENQKHLSYRKADRLVNLQSLKYHAYICRFILLRHIYVLLDFWYLYYNKKVLNKILQ